MEGEGERDGTMAASDPMTEARVAAEQPRLMISNIVCTNFKSYAGIKELGPFHKVCKH